MAFDCIKLEIDVIEIINNEINTAVFAFHNCLLSTLSSIFEKSNFVFGILIYTFILKKN
jgi:hypothetical protein